jgi:hypothetical protein
MPLQQQPVCEQNNGEVSERPMEHAWKVCKQKCFQGSNPCLTAINKKPDFSRVFCLWPLGQLGIFGSTGAQFRRRPSRPVGGGLIWLSKIWDHKRVGQPKAARRAIKLAKLIFESIPPGGPLNYKRFPFRSPSSLRIQYPFNML